MVVHMDWSTHDRAVPAGPGRGAHPGEPAGPPGRLGPPARSAGAALRRTARLLPRIGWLLWMLLSVAPGSGSYAGGYHRASGSVEVAARIVALCTEGAAHRSRPLWSLSPSPFACAASVATFCTERYPHKSRPFRSTTQGVERCDLYLTPRNWPCSLRSRWLPVLPPLRHRAHSWSTRRRTCCYASSADIVPWQMSLFEPECPPLPS